MPSGNNPSGGGGHQQHGQGQGQSTSKGGASNQMTKDDSARIQSAQALGGGNMSSSGFAARAQSAADRNANAK